MSGTIIATPMIVPVIESIAPYLASVCSGVAVAGAGVGLALSVKKLVDIQAQAALEHQIKEREKLVAWVAYQQKQLQRMAAYSDMEHAFRDSERRLAAINLQTPALAHAAVAGASPDAPSAHSYLSLGKDRATPEQISAMLEELSQIVISLPEDFQHAGDSPYEKLARHQKLMAQKFHLGDRVLVSELSTFKETIARTLSDFRKELTSRREHLESANKRLENCLNEILFYGHLAASPTLELAGEQSELAVLQQQVAAILASESVNEGAVELLEKKLGTLKATIDKHVVLAAHQRQLPVSLATHLGDIGYEMLEEFAQDDTGAMLRSVMRIPGGEQLQIALHKNGQMAFEVVHERSALEIDAPTMSPEEISFLVQQENKWCRDFRELIRRLAAEGFPFNINFEKALPTESVKVVVVETPDEILAADEHRHYDVKKQYIS